MVVGWGYPGELGDSPTSVVLEPVPTDFQKPVTRGLCKLGIKGYESIGSLKSVTAGVFIPQKLEISRSYSQGYLFAYTCIYNIFVYIIYLCIYIYLSYTFLNYLFIYLFY